MACLLCRTTHELLSQAGVEPCGSFPLLCLLLQIIPNFMIQGGESGGGCRVLGVASVGMHGES